MGLGCSLPVQEAPKMGLVLMEHTWPSLVLRTIQLTGNLALKIFDSNHVCIGVCLQNTPLPCSRWGGGVVLQEEEGEEEAFGLVHPQQSSHVHPGPCCLQNSAAPSPLTNPGVSCSHQSKTREENYPGKETELLFQLNGW